MKIEESAARLPGLRQFICEEGRARDITVVNVYDDNNRAYCASCESADYCRHAKAVRRHLGLPPQR